MIRGVINGGKPFDVRYRLTVSFSGSAPLFGGSAKLTGRWTPTFLDLVEGFVITNGGNDGLVTNGGIRFELPALGIDQTWTPGGTNNGQTGTIELIGVRCLQDGFGTWEIRIQTVRLLIGAALFWSQTGNWVISSPMQPTPSSLPVIGIPPELSGGCGYGPVQVDGCLGPNPLTNIHNYGASYSATGSWGLRFDSVNWISAPIEIFPHASLPGTTLSGNTSGGITIGGFANENVQPHSVVKQSSNAVCFMYPNWPHELVRLEPGNECIVYRWGSPLVQRMDYDHNLERVCATGDETENNTNTPSTIYAKGTQFLENVGDAPGVIEEFITRPKYAPAWVWAFESVALPNTFTTKAEYSGFRTWNSNIETNSSDCSSYLRHFDTNNNGWIPEYFNTITSPYWSYGEWLPKDTAPSSVRWDLDGTDAPESYWKAVFQQHTEHPSLPTAQRTKRRTNLVSALLDQNGVTGLTDQAIGVPSYLGLGEFQVDSGSYPTELVTDINSSARFTSTTGTPNVIPAGIDI